MGQGPRMVVGEGALEEVDASGWVGGGRSGDQGRGGAYRSGEGRG